MVFILLREEEIVSHNMMKAAQMIVYVKLKERITKRMKFTFFGQQQFSTSFVRQQAKNKSPWKFKGFLFLNLFIYVCAVKTLISQNVLINDLQTSGPCSLDCLVIMCVSAPDQISNTLIGLCRLSEGMSNINTAV